MDFYSYKNNNFVMFSIFFFFNFQTEPSRVFYDDISAA